MNKRIFGISTVLLHFYLMNQEIIQLVLTCGYLNYEVDGNNRLQGLTGVARRSARAGGPSARLLPHQLLYEPGPRRRATYWATAEAAKARTITTTATESGIAPSTGASTTTPT